jgi:hAT family C-terminal dimerisation region
VRKTSGRGVYHCIHCPDWSNGYRPNAVAHAEHMHSQLVQEATPQLSNQVFSASEPSLRHVFNKQRYTNAVLGLITRRRLPFSAVEWTEIKEMVLAANPAVEDVLVTTRSHAMTVITSSYAVYARQLKELLQGSQSMVHISSDLWTSPHRRGMLAVCAQWVDKDFRLRKALLGLPECRYSHSGEAQAALITEVLERFSIRNVGYHTGDNATSNDTCLAALSSRLRSEHGIDFDHKRRRVRCIGHIINLSLQAFLLARSKEALTAALAAADIDREEDAFGHFSSSLAKTTGNSAGWEDIPALQKLHSIATWLRSSSLHGDKWREAVGLSLGIDNATRWSSWCAMIGKALTKRSQIVLFLNEHESELGGNVLGGADWDLLGKTHRFLQPFAQATESAEGASSSISQTLALMDVLLLQFERYEDDYSQRHGSANEKMLHAIRMGWFVLEKYYTMTEDVPVYAAALLLNPKYRRAYMDKNWLSDWHESAIAGARSIWINEYQSIFVSDEPDAPVSSPPSQAGDELSELFKMTEVETVAHGTGADDFDAFINARPVTLDVSPLEWWCRAEQRAQYPRLSRMAIDILSIPPESAEAERAFSGARRTVSWDRGAITCENVEKVECVGSWLREKLIVPSAEG